MTLKRAFLDGRESFDPIDAYLLKTIGDRAQGREPGAPPCSWTELYDRAEQRAVTHLFREEDLEAAGEAVAAPYAAARRFSRLIMEKNVRTWQEIAGVFDAAGVRIAGVKGPFLNAVLNRPLHRAPMSVDLDLIAERGTLEQTVDLLESLGFVKGLGIKDQRFYRLGEHGIRDLEQEQGSYGQIAPMARLLSLPDLDDLGADLERWFPRRQLVRTSTGVRSLSSVDLHFDLGHRDEQGEHRIPAQDLIDGAVDAEYLGTGLRAVGLSTTAWLLAYRAYLDTALFGERRFKLFADVAVLLRQGGWSSAAVEEAYSRYPFVQTPVARTLEFLSDECGVEPLDGGVPTAGEPTPTTSLTSTAPLTSGRARPRRRGVLLVCHGWGTARQSSPLVRRLRVKAARQGVEVVELAPFSGPDPTDVSRVAAQLGQEVRAVRRDDPALPVGLVGVSLGSSAVLTAALDGAGADVLVSIGTCLTTDINMPDHPRQVLARHEDRDDNTSVPFLSGTARLGFLRDLADSAPLHRLDELRTPTLVLEGGRDNQWRRRDAEVLRAHTSQQDNGSAYRSFPAGSHTLDDVALGASAEIGAWLDAVGFHRQHSRAGG